MNEQIALFEVDKKCPNCRKVRDVKPKGSYKCVICKTDWYTE